MGNELSQLNMVTNLKQIEKELGDMDVTGVFPDARGNTATQEIQKAIGNIAIARSVLSLPSTVPADELDYVEIPK